MSIYILSADDYATDIEFSEKADIYPLLWGTKKFPPLQISEQWPGFSATIFRNSLTDFVDVGGYVCSSKRVMNHFHDLVCGIVEFLPILIEGNEYFFWNLLDSKIIEEGSPFELVQWKTLGYLELNSELIFRVNQYKSDVFVTDSFLDIIRSEQFSGLCIWQAYPTYPGPQDRVKVLQ